MHLSKRLLACCNYIIPGSRVADVGCDHGYLGIHLLQQGLARQVIAADVNHGPLQSARENAKKYGMEEKMSFFLSDGVTAIPRDFDTLVCAGMGGDTMISILSAAPWLKNTSYRMVLQCQSKTPMLRQYLSENGWYIRAETALRDGRFLYTVMDVVYDPLAPRLTPGGFYFSPALGRTSDPESREYLDRMIFQLRRTLTYGGDDEMAKALNELEETANDYSK